MDTKRNCLISFLLQYTLCTEMELKKNSTDRLDKMADTVYKAINK